MESIDDAINYEEEYKTYLQGVKKNGNSLIAKCPFHDDSKPSLCVDSLLCSIHLGDDSKLPLEGDTYHHPGSGTPRITLRPNSFWITQTDGGTT